MRQVHRRGYCRVRWHQVKMSLEVHKEDIVVFDGSEVVSRVSSTKINCAPGNLLLSSSRIQPQRSVPRLPHLGHTGPPSVGRRHNRGAWPSQRLTAHSIAFSAVSSPTSVSCSGEAALVDMFRLLPWNAQPRPDTYVHEPVVRVHVLLLEGGLEQLGNALRPLWDGRMGGGASRQSRIGCFLVVAKPVVHLWRPRPRSPGGRSGHGTGRRCSPWWRRRG